MTMEKGGEFQRGKSSNKADLRADLSLRPKVKTQVGVLIPEISPGLKKALEINHLCRRSQKLVQHNLFHINLHVRTTSKGGRFRLIISYTKPPARKLKIFGFLKTTHCRNSLFRNKLQTGMVTNTINKELKTGYLPCFEFPIPISALLLVPKYLCMDKLIGQFTRDTDKF